MAPRRAITAPALAGLVALALGASGGSGASAAVPQPIKLRVAWSVGSQVSITAIAVGDGGVW